MKVAVITHNYIRRQGDLTALYLHRLASGLARKGLELIVISPYAPGLLRSDIIDGVKVVRFAYPFHRRKPIAYTGNMHQEVSGSFWAKIVFAGFLWSFYRTARSVCRKEKVDLLWANWWIPPGLVAARLASKLNLPLIISSHGTDISLLGKQGILKKLSRYVYGRTKHATVVSTFLKNRLLENVPLLSSDQVSVVPMPVGMESFPKTPPPQNKIPIFLSVARYTKQKQLDTIIQAAALLKEKGTACRIILIGEGPLEGELAQKARDKKLEDNVEFVSLVAQQKLGEYYRRSDAVILCSEGEGFGLVLVEAGLSGRPVIGVRSGGIVDIIDDGVNGLLCELGDSSGLADCMARIIQDDGLRHELGEGGYRKAMEHFSTPVLVDRIYQIFMAAAPSPQAESPA